MPEIASVHTIYARVKHTFEILRQMFSETPPDPSVKNPGLDLATESAVSEQINQGQVEKTRMAIIPSVRAVRKNMLPKARVVIPLDETHRRYLENLLDRVESVSLPGVLNDGQAVRIPLEQFFVPLFLIDKRIGFIRPERDDGFYGGAAGLSLSSALQRYRRLVITGGPGSGKSTLLHVMLLVQCRALLEESEVTTGKLRLLTAEDQHLPVIMSLREFGLYLKTKKIRANQDGPTRMMNFLLESAQVGQAEGQLLPENFFNTHFSSGNAIILLDGLDEIDDARLRLRVCKTVEKFIKQYPDCRYVVTSRLWGYAGTEPFGQEFGSLQIREFGPAEARQFVRAFGVTIEGALAESTGLSRHLAEKLAGTLETNPRLAEMAISPLALTLLALVQRDREELSESRIDLMEAALQVLFDFRLGAHGISDLGDARRVLEMLAFHMQQNNRCEMARAEINALLIDFFRVRLQDNELQAVEAAEAFLRIMSCEGGLFRQVRPDLFAFVWRDLQELLAAHVLAGREDTLACTLEHLASPWWRNVILFEAGLVNKLAKYRISELIHFILESAPRSGLEDYNAAFLAAECLFDLNLKNLEVRLADDVKKSLRKLVNSQTQGDRQALVNKVIASNALVGLQAGIVQARFWTPPFGEPEWVRIPAGLFWMGEDGAETHFAHRVNLPEYRIARVPVTNAQYALFLDDTGLDEPEHWCAGLPPRGRENHPVVNVSWHDATAYCDWLSARINQRVCLPSEAEWEKAARGALDKREYPWGAWDELRANTAEFAYGDTTPVGLFPGGASPYGLLDMCGNVREWTRSLADYGYPYDPAQQARENLTAPDDQARVQRGGSFYYTGEFARCSQRQRFLPDFKFLNFGFRVMILTVAG